MPKPQKPSDEIGGVTFHYAQPTDDKVRGGNGFDVMVYSGSIWDFFIKWGDRDALIVSDLNRDDGYMGLDNLYKFEALQFDDAYMLLTEDNPTTIDAPDGPVRVTVGETVTYTVTITDYDDLFEYNFNDAASVYDTGILYWDYTGGGWTRMGRQTELTFRYTPDRVNIYRTFDPVVLAEGEIREQRIVFDIVMPDGTVIQQETVIELVGVNDAPVLEEGFRSLSATQGQTAAFLDLAAIASDIDSDDDGATLNFEILSAPAGFGARIEGGRLVLDPGSAVDGFDTDEFLEGEVVLRAVDRHGAASNEITVDLTVYGAGLPETPLVWGDGGIKWNAIGIGRTDAPWRLQYDGLLDDPSYPALVTGTEGDDIIQLRSKILRVFQDDDFFYGAQGVTNYETLPIQTFGGDDIVSLVGHGQDFTLFQFVDVGTGMGDDIVVVDMRSPGAAIAQGMNISTAQGSDQVLVQMRGGLETAFWSDVSTGSGHDVVSIRLLDSDTTSLGGYQSVNGSFDLGSGDDWLKIRITGENALSSAALGTSIDAGTGDDFVFFSNAKVGLRPDAIGFMGGFDGEIEMGAGNDRLILDLSEATGWGHELVIDGDGDTWRGGAGDADFLRLRHLTAGSDFTVEGAGGVFRLTHYNQDIVIRNFETVLLGDGTNLFDLV
ncbi:hypothetical protein [Litorisediminicola beolgyonensis]|uniref:Cadherin domain-containing protein n=1 Tax=Litorisediminicola beolgyonensis TaxID=1173614 RepID=A0ABW3ZP99_9RHOB